MPTSWGSTGRETTRVPGGRSGSIELVRMLYGVAPATRGIPTPTTRSAAAPSRSVQIGTRTSQRRIRRSREPEGALTFMLGAAVQRRPGRPQLGFAPRVSWVSETVRALRVAVRFWVSLPFTVVLPYGIVTTNFAVSVLPLSDDVTLSPLTRVATGARLIV